ncbi:hypothetical protein DdX_07431 [Ditylenchus destructor]|uniref:Uncharacterized protein n=1 Tax=Ditylenchus destructor TaxID=166010 RepID=A0AAD4N5T5_9BILA|nr:hypothetical protein DdX_07431 [Ditylenchus destructor]
MNNSTICCFYDLKRPFLGNCHGLHRVAEEVRAAFPEIDQLISNTKKVFVKAPSRIKKFKELCADLPLPPQPILTRWGTWIYYSNNFDAVKAVINSLETEDAASIRISQELFNKQGIAHQLANIQCNFSILPKAITKLESQGLTLSQSLDVLAEVKAAISNSGGQIGQKIQSKLEFVLRNNPGLSKMKEIAKVQNGEEAEMEVMSHRNS